MQVGRAVRDAAVAVDGQPEAAASASSSALCVGGSVQPSRLADAVGEEAQRPLRGHRRVELAHRAGRGVARIDVRLLARAPAWRSFSVAKSRRVM